VNGLTSPFAYTVKLAECGSKHLALYLAIREAITEGKLPPGARLPSTRQLAAMYELSRGSVSVAYEMLTAEGFVHAGIGQGTFVTGWKQEDALVKSMTSSVDAINEPLAAPALTRWGRQLMQQPSRPRSLLADSNPFFLLLEGVEPLSFVPEGVGTGWFPWMEWRAKVAFQWKNLGTSWNGDNNPTEGNWQLRQAIASRLRRERGISCEAEDIIVTSGSLQAIALLTQLLLEEGQTAVIENPCYFGIQRAIRATGAQVISGSVDSSGIVPQDWDAKLLFVTPTRQFPTGAVLSYDRRRTLLSWASRHNAWIVEDDYDSDFRWGGRPVEPLKSLDREGRVVYVGTFSRSMSVGVRIGYAVVPKELIPPFIAAKKLYDSYPTGIAEQQALSEWMGEGGYDRHMRRLRRIFGRLEGKLRNSLERQLGELFEVSPSDAGLHLYAKWKKTVEDYERLVQECIRSGVEWRDGTVYENCPKTINQPAPSALFGFAHLNEELIEEGINRIRNVAKSLGLIDSNEGQGGTVHA